MVVNYENKLMNKNGRVVVALAKEFLQIPQGGRIPTITEMAGQVDSARGTVQNALTTLRDSGAVQICPRGHLGSYLEYKNVPVLLAYAGVKNFVGAMPLPYSLRYEAMSTALSTSLEAQYHVPVFLTYMRGADHRAGLVLDERCDFAVMSKYAAGQLAQKDSRIVLIQQLGPGSYCGAHALMFHDPGVKEIMDGMRVGVDRSSVDQYNLTIQECHGKKVKFIDLEYHSFLSQVRNGQLDAALWNLDEIMDRHVPVNYRVVGMPDKADTNAVLIGSAQRPELITLLRNMVHPDEILRLQKEVMEGKRMPSY